MMSAEGIGKEHSRRARLACIRLALCGLFIVYAIQLRSPLRINTDATVILRLTAELTDGKPYLINGARPIYPIGMPLTYSLMERAGIANPIGFGLLNLICISIAGYSTWLICRALGMRETGCASVVLISFSNFVLIKHSVLPLTDIPYMMLSLGCVALLEIFPDQRGGAKILALMLAVLLAGGAVLVRRVGVALIPAVCYAAWPSKQQAGALKSLLFGNGARLLLLIVTGLAAFIVAATVSRHLLYVPDMYFGGSFKSVLIRQVSIRLHDFGELLINAPAAKLGRVHPAIVFAGLVLLSLISLGLWRARFCWQPAHIYFMFYLAILAIWPFADARFWIPVLPLIVITVVQGAMPPRYPGITRWAMITYLALYALTSLGAVAYTTRITFAGRRFPEIYGSGATRLAYERAWWGAGAGDVPDSSDEATAIIRRYGMPGAPR